jgi:hypothetical protein
MKKYIKDFAKSDAPQFKGKSQEKKREMAIAAKLSQQNEERKPYPQFKVGELVKYKLKDTGIYNRPFRVISTNNGIRVKSLSSGEILNAPINSDQWELTTTFK